MDKEFLFDNLFKWLRTFEAASHVTTVEQVSDGLIFSKVLNSVCPDFFNETWMTKIKSETENNWRLKVSNLKKILKALLDYYSQILDQHISDFQMPDINEIAEHNSRGETGRLLQLIVGCAVNCEHKDQYIQKIMAMEEAVQHSVMEAIKELMSKDPQVENLSELEEKSSLWQMFQLRKTMDEYKAALQAKDEMAQRCHELDIQISLLHEEKTLLQSENTSLTQRANTAEQMLEAGGGVGGGGAQIRMRQLQEQVEALQDELFRLEAAKEELRVKLETIEKENTDYKQKLEALTKQADEARLLKDELDIVKERADQVVKYESAIEQYKRKAGESGDLRRQNKILEEKNTSYLQRVMELEEEVRKGSLVRSQMEAYKKQVAEVQTRCSEETKRADRAEFETRRAQEKMEAVGQEKERLLNERDSLREKNDELLLAEISNATTASSPGAMDELDVLSLPPEARERVVRLEAELRSLRARLVESPAEDPQALKDLLEDARARQSELESENRISHQRIMELAAQVEDLESQLTQTGGSVQVTPGQGSGQGGDRERQLEEQLTKKEEEMEKVEQEMRRMEEKYKRYLEKARNVIRQSVGSVALGNGSMAGSSDVQTLRHQLTNKERIIEQLEKHNEKIVLMQQAEEKLVVAAWYNLGVRLNREAAEDRLQQQTGAGHSFLARQRVAHVRPRPTHPSPSKTTNSHSSQGSTGSQNR